MQKTVAILMLLGLAAAEEAEDVHGLRPPVGPAQLVERAQKARAAGFAYLLKVQNKDGTWGSHDPKTPRLKNFGFGTGNRGSQDGVRAACTALCAHALLEKKQRTPAEEAALKKAIEPLLGTEKFAYHKGESFNTWGYGYKLDFLARLHAAPEGAPIKERIRKAAAVCIAGLKKFQQHEGGWGYYAGPMHDFSSMSFNTAVFAAALHRAKAQGMDVPKGMIGDAVKCVMLQRVPDGSFVYDSRFIRRSGSHKLANLGAAARTAACAWGLYEVGRYKKDDLKQALAIFRKGENYLESGRKLIVPHSAPQQISGYFFFFGYYYAAHIATELGNDVAQKDWDRLAWTMMRTQEPGGEWWDTAAADYGDKWGTGMALIVLQRYLDTMALRKPPEKE